MGDSHHCNRARGAYYSEGAIWHLLKHPLYMREEEVGKKDGGVLKKPNKSWVRYCTMRGGGELSPKPVGQHLALSGNQEEVGQEKAGSKRGIINPEKWGEG